MIYINTVNYSRKIKAHWRVNRKVKKQSLFAKSCYSNVRKENRIICKKTKQNNNRKKTKKHKKEEIRKCKIETKV